MIIYGDALTDAEKDDMDRSYQEVERLYQGNQITLAERDRRLDALDNYWWGDEQDAL